MTPSQRRILEWLLAYPGVELNAVPGSWVSWTASWADENARQSMMAVIPRLFGADIAERAAPRTLPLPGGTPRCTRTTFLALQRRGWLRMTRYRKPKSGWAFSAYYQISRAGLDALAAEHERGVPMELEQPRSMQTCECGWQGRSIGGHRQGPRHLEWLRYRAYCDSVRSQSA